MNIQTTSPALLSSFKLGDLLLKNRVVLAPLTRSRAGEARMPNALMAKYYAQRAAAGLIITEATVISTQGIGWQNTPGIYSDEQLEAWKQIVTAVHTHETPIFMQLWHCGRASHSSFHENGELPVAASAIAINGEGLHTPVGKQPYETPRALETHEIGLIVEDYRKAAERAKKAGFDGVEIHAANGYLIDTFLQSKTNHRTDAYGGGIENRYRFLKEIVEAIITVFPAHRVGVRLSPNGIFNDMGSPDYRPSFLYIAGQLNTYNLAYLHLMDGLAFGFHEMGTPMTLAEFREVFAGTLIGNCGYTQELAETAISSGVADLIAFGRDFISNPDLVERFTHGWPLNPPAEMSTWYSFGPEGYVDFPTYEASQAAS
ncbi:MAG: alkene reductase [Oscillatoriales cyanobacterium]|uniref:Alkene reductase n=1 Tax=Microcoleus anatoxicus PTRS2 TaxID=2705321 RepID=A0ABU8YIV7_9CYAN|nr:MAG: alkene reductase [Oscillatoriales cyanobacterium]TAD96941.1 MAG: alkene reductase [Oscillatoriales cyanobacterium]TAE00751.1 MAG: alkene reductase [Oscillatoriales cyanobacterium]TAF03859.1 MAG: alkene reductase [Oscillatoriales cyanobacterium]TAF38648.1 MAG: alkene reductase [Oscillatoriales cyanobacterium]